MQFTTNGHTALDEQDRERAKNFLDSLSTVNLDEVVTEVIDVALRDIKFVPAVDEAGEAVRDEQGKQKMQMVRYTRTAHIENYVPMKVFNRMLASRARVTKAREQYLTRVGNESVRDEQDPMLTWMLEQVHAVWIQSEPDMTLERLAEGLTFEKVSRLFSRFFGHLLQTNRT